MNEFSNFIIEIFNRLAVQRRNQILLFKFGFYACYLEPKGFKISSLF